MVAVCGDEIPNLRKSQLKIKYTNFFYVMYNCTKYISILINHLKTKDRLLNLRAQFVPRSKHIYLGYKN